MVKPKKYYSDFRGRPVNFFDYRVLKRNKRMKYPHLENKFYWGEYVAQKARKVNLVDAKGFKEEWTKSRDYAKTHLNAKIQREKVKQQLRARNHYLARQRLYASRMQRERMRNEQAKTYLLNRQKYLYNINRAKSIRHINLLYAKGLVK